MQIGCAIYPFASVLYTCSRVVAGSDILRVNLLV
jgi:hypothetical protein